LPESVLQEVGRLDPAAIAQVQQEAWPDVRDADELHDALLTFIALPENRAQHSIQADVIPSEAATRERPAFGSVQAAPEPRELHLSWSGYLETLLASRRACVARVSDPRTRIEDPGHTRVFWVAAERAAAFRAI